MTLGRVLRTTEEFDYCSQAVALLTAVTNLDQEAPLATDRDDPGSFSVSEYWSLIMETIKNARIEGQEAQLVDSLVCVASMMVNRLADELHIPVDTVLQWVGEKFAHHYAARRAAEG